MRPLTPSLNTTMVHDVTMTTTAVMAGLQNSYANHSNTSPDARVNQANNTDDDGDNHGEYDNSPPFQKQT